MAFTRNQISITVSAIILIGLTVLGIRAFYISAQLSLPIPRALHTFTLILPAIAGLTVQILRQLSSSSPHQASSNGHLRLLGTSSDNEARSSSLVTGTIATPLLGLLTVYETVVVTLASVYLAPGVLQTCGLEQRWQALFRGKNEDAIRAIQDAFQCCGFNSVRHQAWPFPSKGHGDKSCAEAFGRDRACREPWRGEEQRVAAMLLGIGVVVFLWKVVVISAPAQHPKWFARIWQRQRHEDAEQRTTRYLPDSERYRDDAVEEIDDDGAVQQPSRAAIAASDGVRSVVPGAANSAEENAWRSQRT